MAPSPASSVSWTTRCPGGGLCPAALWFNESERRHVFHLAARFSIDDTDWTGDRKNQLVLIGRDIDHSKLRATPGLCGTG